MITLHPPCGKDEIFIGNTESYRKMDHLSQIRSLRLAYPAYDITGKALPAIYAAMFLNREEESIYDRIMMSRMRKIA